MHYAHVLEDGGAVVGDDDFTLRSLDHLVHSSWAERSPYGVGDGCEQDGGEWVSCEALWELDREGYGTFGSGHVTEPDFHWLLIAL